MSSTPLSNSELDSVPPSDDQNPNNGNNVEGSGGISPDEPCSSNSHITTATSSQNQALNPPGCSSSVSAIQLNPSKPSGDIFQNKPSTSRSPEGKKYVMSHKYQKRRLTTKEMARKKEVLAKYECPFAEKCKMKEKCFFSHVFDGTNPAIKRLPVYACVNYISGGCVITPFARKNYARKKCKRGLHLTYDDLDNLAAFELNNSQELRDHMCPVCLDNQSFHNKTTHGYMVNCTHVFCLPCLRQCFEQKHECPLCRTVGPYVPSVKPPKKKIKELARKKFERRSHRAAQGIQHIEIQLVNSNIILSDPSEFLRDPYSHDFFDFSSDEDWNDDYDEDDLGYDPFEI